ncbi:hypothetical protein SteCoe_13681 [Stentor coeruleus]|uniref:Translation elongation factor EF1B beta/delta subunit guanine nucleotide exchange domain-containing protein n=1 Tax=Stentor coeruleus TaxID=5963 RepID=A0A1R2C7U6_9CILI|nr:hypothetical protein SteCoe_13681 [Stentor coeruleus]
MAAPNPKELETILSTSAFLCGDRPSAEDNKVFKLFASAPDHTTYPNLWGWYTFVLQFTDAVKAHWPDLTPKPVEKKPAEEEFEDDLFADDPEAEEEAKKIADAKAADKKQAPVGKSNVVFDVKPVSSSVDLDVLAKRIFEEVALDGLIWGEQYKKAPVAFGIFKLVIGCTILDTVETEVIIEKITELSGELKVEDEDEDGEGLGTFATVEDAWVQSVDIANFQKI